MYFYSDIHTRTWQQSATDNHPVPGALTPFLVSGQGLEAFPTTLEQGMVKNLNEPGKARNQILKLVAILPMKA